MLANTGANNYLGYATAVYDSNSASMNFPNGEENLKLEVTDYFKAFLIMRQELLLLMADQQIMDFFLEWVMVKNVKMLQKHCCWSKYFGFC